MAVGDIMLNISDDFFKEEIRLGFTVTETMKKAWAIQLEMLDSIMSIAQKHNIPIWADYGTLLGAVRHKGFIPWDDDTDLSMLRKDYMKFPDILKAELPSDFQIFSFYSSNDYDQPKIFIANRRYLDYGNSLQEAELTKIQHGCPYITGIDIFPLDYVPSDIEQFNLIYNLYASTYDLAFNYDHYRSNGELEGYLTQLETLLSTKVERDEHLRTSLWKLADAIAMMTYKNEATEVAYYPSLVVDGPHKKCKVLNFDHTKYLDFEMIQLPAPAEYEAVLTSTYGSDYMTPVRGTAWHDYPFYKNQDRRILINSKLGQMGDVF